MLTLNKVTISYPDGTIGIKELSIKIKQGERIALVGANAAGKTTFMQALVGILPIAKGEISFEADGKSLKQSAGYVFQNPDSQLFMPTVFEDVAFGLRNEGVQETEVKKKVEQVLEQLGIAYLSGRSPVKMSGGEKRMAAIATVLVMNPKLLILDEPTVYLDPKARRHLINVLNELPQTKLIATHDLAFAKETCDRVILLRKGELYADGIADEILYDKPLMDACDMEELVK